MNVPAGASDLVVSQLEYIFQAFAVDLMRAAVEQSDESEGGGSFVTLHVHIGLHDNRRFARCLIVRAGRVNLIPKNFRPRSRGRKPLLSACRQHYCFAVTKCSAISVPAK